jgi:hypothetical protein
MFNLYHPQIPFYHIDIEPYKLSQSLINRTVKYKGHFFHVNPSTLQEIQILLNDYEKGVEERHYCEVIKNFNNVSGFSFKSPVFSNDIEESVNKKTRNLNKESFVFIVSEANFVFGLSDNFWRNLVGKFKEKGYDVFINNSELNIAEALYLAQKAKGCVGLRCGFTELLSTLDIPKHIIYTPCKYHSIPQIRKILSLKKYPFVNPDTIFEYDASDEIINEILRRF